jgi:phosphatidylserine decarboxylase
LPAGWPAAAGGITTGIIRRFIRRYGVNMDEAQQPDPAAYATFNDFFTRALKPGARPLAQADLVCPVDGAISQFGPLQRDQLLQAKGHHYSSTALVGGDAALAARFDHGHFACLYLSPRDYHRIHMPCDGRLTRMIHVPGELFSVNPTTARGVPGCSRATSGWSACSRGAALRAGAGGRHHRRQHGHRLARRGQPAAAGPGARMALRRQRRARAAAPGRGDGPLPAGLHRGDAVPEGPLQFNPAWAPGGAIRLGEAMARRG